MTCLLECLVLLLLHALRPHVSDALLLRFVLLETHDIESSGAIISFGMKSEHVDASSVSHNIVPPSEIKIFECLFFFFDGTAREDDAVLAEMTGVDAETVAFGRSVTTVGVALDAAEGVGVGVDAFAAVEVDDEGDGAGREALEGAARAAGERCVFLIAMFERPTELASTSSASTRFAVSTDTSSLAFGLPHLRAAPPPRGAPRALANPRRAGAELAGLAGATLLEVDFDGTACAGRAVFEAGADAPPTGFPHCREMRPRDV